MSHYRIVVVSCIALVVVGVAASQTRTGFLAPGELDVSKLVEPAPRRGDPRFETDRQIFKATRKLEGGPRWQMANNDADYSVPALLNDFSCSVGAQLTTENAPKFVALVQRASSDTSGQTSRAKDLFARERPFTIDKGPICQPTSELFDKRRQQMSYDYPSGHATRGWTWALVLTAAVPERAQEILARGRAYADSRFICGAHNESAVEAGMQSASATMALVSAKSDYQNALRDVRAELADLRQRQAAPMLKCKAEQALIAERVMPKLDEVR